MTNQNPDSETKKQKKDLEILACSSEFYLTMKDRNVSAYEIFPLRVNYELNWDHQYIEGRPLDELVNKAKELGCDAIADLKQITNWEYGGIILATGLKLKQEKP